MRRAVFLLALLLAVAGCSSGPSRKASSPTLPPRTTTAAPTTQVVAAKSTSPRGNLVKTLGQEASIVTTDNGTVVTFTVDAIRVDPKCDSGYANNPQNGYFLAIDLRVSTSPTLPANSMNFTAQDFSVVGADGVMRQNLETGASDNCLSASELLSDAPLSPGSQYRGSIVVDSPVASGILVYRPPVVPGGWEWNFG